MAISTAKREYYEKLFPKAEMTVGSMSGDGEMSQTDYDFWLAEQPEPEEHALRENEDLSKVYSLRQQFYPREEDQLHTIIAAFEYLKSKGTDVGPDMDALLKTFADVKAKFPKPADVADKSYPQTTNPLNDAALQDTPDLSKADLALS